MLINRSGTMVIPFGTPLPGPVPRWDSIAAAGVAFGMLAGRPVSDTGSDFTRFQLITLGGGGL